MFRNPQSVLNKLGYKLYIALAHFFYYNAMAETMNRRTSPSYFLYYSMSVSLRVCTWRMIETFCIVNSGSLV